MDRLSGEEYLALIELYEIKRTQWIRDFEKDIKNLERLGRESLANENIEMAEKCFEEAEKTKWFIITEGEKVESAEQARKKVLAHLNECAEQNRETSRDRWLYIRFAKRSAVL